MWHGSEIEPWLPGPCSSGPAAQLEAQQQLAWHPRRLRCSTTPFALPPAGATIAALSLGRFVFLPFHRASLAKAGLPTQNGQTHLAAGDSRAEEARCVLRSVSAAGCVRVLSLLAGWLLGPVLAPQSSVLTTRPPLPCPLIYTPQLCAEDQRPRRVHHRGRHGLGRAGPRRSVAPPQRRCARGGALRAARRCAVASHLASRPAPPPPRPPAAAFYLLATHSLTTKVTPF